LKSSLSIRGWLIDIIFHFVHQIVHHLFEQKKNILSKS
jgi:hypothetical protein